MNFKKCVIRGCQSNSKSFYCFPESSLWREEFVQAILRFGTPVEDIDFETSRVCRKHVKAILGRYGSQVRIRRARLNALRKLNSHSKDFQGQGLVNFAKILFFYQCFKCLDLGQSSEFFYSRGASSTWENFSQMGEQNLGPNRRFSPKWENTFPQSLVPA